MKKRVQRRLTFGRNAAHDARLAELHLAVAIVDKGHLEGSAVNVAAAVQTQAFGQSGRQKDALILRHETRLNVHGAKL